jgi:two-component sensor histidine kinase
MGLAAIEQEEMRLALLRGYNILDTAPEEDFDSIAKLAAEICEAPIALVSLVEEDRQWFKTCIGTDLRETPIDQSICSHAVSLGDYLEIEDTTQDERTKDNHLVTGPEHIRFYAGALLQDDKRLPLGTLCVLDRRPRKLNDLQRKTLQVLGQQVMRQIELRSALGAAEMLRKEVDHRVKNSLQSLEAMIRIQMRNEKSDEATRALGAVQRRLAMVSQLHEALYLADAGAVVDIAAFLEKVLRSATMQMPVGIRVLNEVEPCSLNSREANAIGMILAEALTNSSKYAFADAKQGTFTVRGRKEGGDYVLILQDDGSGMQTAEGQIAGTGMGTLIMQAAAQQLGGSISHPASDVGHTVEIRWPMD